MTTKESLDAPRLEKWPFVLGDLLCLGAAAGMRVVMVPSRGRGKKPKE